MTFVKNKKTGEVFEKKEREGIITVGKSVRDGREDFVVAEKEIEASEEEAFIDAI